jgi:linoleoyl-CoA desaturase
MLPALRYARTHVAFRREVLAALGSDDAPATEHAPARRKVLILGALVASSYALLLSGRLEGPLLLACIAVSQPIYLITAMGVAHDASHSGLARRSWLNRLGTFVFDLLGINGYIWHFDHVTAHHSAPNVSRYDANLYGWGPIRMDPYSPLRPWHRYQHLYAPFIYALASLFKVFLGDFIAFTRTRVEAYLPAAHPRSEIVRLVAFKLWAIFVALGLPLLINGQVAIVLAGYVLGHVCAGLLMGSIFQPTHTNEWVTWPKPDAHGRLSISFEQQVLATTADFSIDSRWVTWLAGGLNIHAVHHLFPRLTHLHLPRAAALVKAIAEKHGLRYRTFPTWRSAVASHIRALHRLGRAAPEAVSVEGELPAPVRLAV